MAYGDSSDILTKLKKLIPPGWFSLVAPLRDAVLGGISDELSASYSLLEATKAAQRVNTTTGWLLDLTVYDFFGESFLRRAGESDDSFRSRFVLEIFRERVTKQGIAEALYELTGRMPKVSELFSAGDAGGGYSIGAMGYSVAGQYGSLQYPNQIFVTAYRPQSSGIPLISGYGVGPGGYSALGSSASYGSLTDVVTPVTDADIYAAVAATSAAGITPWVAIQS